MDPKQSAILLRRARAGSMEAVDAIFRRVGDRLLAIIRLRLGRELRSRLESGDILQATLLKAFERFEQFDGSGSQSFMGWLAAIARNQIHDELDYHHRDRRDARRNVPMEELVGGRELAARVRSQVSRIQWMRDAELFERALDRLPEEHREVILLRKLEELSFGEIGDLMGRSPEACRKLLARAMTALTREICRQRDPTR